MKVLKLGKVPNKGFVRDVPDGVRLLVSVPGYRLLVEVEAKRSAFCIPFTPLYSYPDNMHSNSAKGVPHYEKKTC